MKSVSPLLRALGAMGMGPVWLVTGCVALVSFVLVYPRPSDLPSTPPHPAFVARASPLSGLWNNDRIEISLPSGRLRAALTEVAHHDFLRWNQLIHGLRLWGPHADRPGKWTGKRMLDVVCSAEQSQQVFRLAPHLLNRNGLQFGHLIEDGQPQGEKHLDETLSVFGEIGINSDHPILVYNQTTTVGDVVRAAASNFRLEQDLDFSLVGFAHYFPPQRAWTNKFGQTITFDDACDRLCNQPMSQGNCSGCHVLYSLAITLAADRQIGILSDVSRRKVLAKLHQAADALRQSQRGDGCWGTQWFDPSKAAPQADFLGSLSVTGHSLEWLAVAPQELIGDPKMISRGCEGLMNLLLNAPSGPLRENYNTYTHAANALKLWSPQAWNAATTAR